MRNGAPANVRGPVGGVTTRPTETRSPVSKSRLRMYLPMMLRSLTEVKVPASVLNLTGMTDLAEIVSMGKTQADRAPSLIERLLDPEDVAIGLEIAQGRLEALIELLVQVVEVVERKVDPILGEGRLVLGDLEPPHGGDERRRLRGAWRSRRHTGWGRRWHPRHAWEAGELLPGVGAGSGRRSCSRHSVARPRLLRVPIPKHRPRHPRWDHQPRLPPMARLHRARPARRTRLRGPSQAHRLYRLRGPRLALRRRQGALPGTVVSPASSPSRPRRDLFARNKALGMTSGPPTRAGGKIAVGDPEEAEKSGWGGPFEGLSPAHTDSGTEIPRMTVTSPRDENNVLFIDCSS